VSKNQRNASSQAAWALLTEGVSKSRVETHRLEHLIGRSLRLVERSPEREYLYQVAGDIIMGLPARLNALKTTLDRTSLALSKMGVDFLESRLPLSEKVLVDEAVQSAFGKANPRHSALISRVADRYLQDQEGE
jgi:hypothetical protein